MNLFSVIYSFAHDLYEEHRHNMLDFMCYHILIIWHMNGLRASIARPNTFPSTVTVQVNEAQTAKRSRLTFMYLVNI